MFAQTIQGIQSSGVMATGKHLIGNEQEHFRQAPEAAGFGFNISSDLSSNIDDKTMHELYLWYATNVSCIAIYLSKSLQAFCRRSPSRCRFDYVFLPASQQ